MDIHAYVFDFDGTLADSRECSVVSTQEAFKKMGLSIPDAKDIESYMGIPIEVSFKEMSQNSLSAEKLDQLFYCFREIYKSYENELIKTFPHVEDILQEIKSLQKQLYIVSSKHSNVLERNLKSLGIYHFFDDVISADKVEYFKPHPDGINKIIEKNKFDRKRVMMIGDAIYDIQMAKAAKVVSCGVTWGCHSEELLAKENPDYLIHNFHELLDLCTVKY